MPKGFGSCAEGFPRGFHGHPLRGRAPEALCGGSPSPARQPSHLCAMGCLPTCAPQLLPLHAQSSLVLPPPLVWYSSIFLCIGFKKFSFRKENILPFPAFPMRAARLVPGAAKPSHKELTPPSPKPRKQTQ